MKKILIFLMSFISLTHLSSMKKLPLLLQESIHEMPDYLKQLVEIIQKKKIELALFCIQNLPKDELNRLYKIKNIKSLLGHEEFKSSKSECPHGYSLLHIVVFYRCWQLIVPLYEQGADLFIKSSLSTGSITPLGFALQKKDFYCAAEIIKCVPDTLANLKNNISKL